MSDQLRRRRKQRADAVRSVTAIVDAAIDLLGARPEASIEDIAQRAGVARQTVYAHFPSREVLVRAVEQRALAETIATIEAAELQRGPAAEALDRLVQAGWRTLERYPVLMELRRDMSAEEELALHGPILERLERLVRRGQRRGEFDRSLPPAWLLTAFLALSHAAAEEVKAARLSPPQALDVLRRSVLRLFGAEREGARPT